MADKVLDARNLNCPLPILKTKRAIGQIDVGGTLEVLATDPGAPFDFAAYADSTGHSLLAQSEDDSGVFRFLLRREA
jgi:tRNA 2-thiouridine synthesizing protein A